MTRTSHHLPVTPDTIAKIELALAELENNMDSLDPHMYELEQSCPSELLEKSKRSLRKQPTKPLACKGHCIH